MPRQHHYIKCETDFFQAVEHGEKRFELRKNDRNYRMYDCVYLQESVNGAKTGREIGPLEITYILAGKDAEKFGLVEGHCIFGWTDFSYLD